MGKVARSYRLDEGLVSRVEVEAKRLGQSYTVFVSRALEQALGGSISSPGGASRSSAPVRASVPSGRPSRREGESQVAFNIRFADWQRNQ